MKKLGSVVLAYVFEGIMKMAGVGFVACVCALYGYMAYGFAYPMITIIWYPDEVAHYDFFKYLIAGIGTMIAGAMLIVPTMTFLREQQQEVE